MGAETAPAAAIDPKDRFRAGLSCPIRLPATRAPRNIP